MSSKNISTATKDRPCIAILQTGSLSDMLMTIKACESFKELHSDLRIILITRSRLQTELNFLLTNKFDEIYTFDNQKIFNGASQDGIRSAIYRLNEFLSTLAHENIDVLINLSQTTSSNYLSSVIQSKQKIGNHIDLNNQVVTTDKWSQVMASTVLRGPLNPFSIVDMYRNIIGIKTIDNSQSKKILPKTNWITIHPFSVNDKATWRAEKWVEVIYKTLKDNSDATICLIGSKANLLKSQLITENPLLKQFKKRIENLTGKTKFSDAFELISQSRLYIGHESTLTHLAAHTSTPTLTIALGTTRAQEIIPYQANAYLVSPRTNCHPCVQSTECSGLQCHHDIPYQLISNVVKKLYNDSELDLDWSTKNISAFHLSSVSFYKTSITERLNLHSLTTESIDTQEMMRSFYKIAWSFLLNDQEINLPFPKLGLKSYSDLIDATGAIGYFFELCEFGKKYSRFILEEISSETPNISKIKDFSLKIDEIDNLQKMILKSSIYLTPVVEYHMLRKGNLVGSNIVELTESSYYAFEEAAQLSSILFELFENSINYHREENNLAKPHINEIK